jgi:hypothetical protein
MCASVVEDDGKDERFMMRSEESTALGVGRKRGDKIYKYAAHFRED